MTPFLVLAALLAIFALTEGGAGPLSPRAASFFALLILVPVLAAISRDATRGRFVRWLGIAVLAAAFWWTSGTARLFVLAAALGSTAFFAQPSAAARTATLAALLFAVFAATRDYVPLWVPLSSLAEQISAQTAAAVGAEARFGPTRFGLWTAAAAIAVALATAATHGRRAFACTAIATTMALLTPPLALVLGVFANRDARFAFIWPGQEEAVWWLLLLPTALLARHVAASARNLSRTALVAAAAAVFAGLVLLAGSRGVPDAKPRILLEGRGGFTLDRLAWGSYGPDAPQGASLASLPDALGAWGFPLTISSSVLTAASLAEQDVLVVMNPTAAFEPEEHAAIWDFVDRGGGLLVLGDHTNILGTRAPLDSLLAPSGIRVAFDSAIPEVERWTWYGCARMAPHPVLRDVHDENDVKISVGASLVLHGGAVPLIYGRHAFSDAGDSTNTRGAYLGNMVPDPSERRGDLVVAAEARHGRGKVIAFGDTSPFQRGSIAHSRDLVMRLFVYLGTPGHVSFDAAWRAAGAMLLGAGCLLLVFGGAGPAAIAGLAAVAALVLLAIDRTARVALSEPDRSRVAWIDVSHGNRVDLHAGRDEGISGLSDHLSRHGWLPLSMKHFDAKDLTQARAFLTVAPAFPYREAERRAIVRFVEDGGLLVVASGYEEGRGSASLLAEFGFSIGSTPLGAAHAANSHLETPGVLMNEAWPVLSTARDVIVLAETWDIPFIAMRHVGRGAILVIGDSRFLGDAKLETAEQAIEPNIEFFRRSIELALTPAGSS